MMKDITPYKTSESKHEQVEAMFDGLAPTYDYVNHTLSLGIDRIWRKRAMNYLKKRQSRPSRILDVATGTGDFAILAMKDLKADEVVGIDISDEMMKVGRKKAEAADLEHAVRFMHEDCSALSFAEKSFDAVISAFAMRNFEDIPQCLSEMYRVLNDGGDIVVIDLCAPHGFPMKQVFSVYKKHIMPHIGKTVSKDVQAFKYLPETMEAVQQGAAMAELFMNAGFRNVNYKYLNFGMCCMYTAVK
ncbi:MAG: bifunctional demethylmenaquinone methyltransferase/2-methoxy-6-polyprenyl-1,4-benzoquinol methylase UbiE [Bacteroidaceae bacterium]|nr:bifunctional demethylmenaquinone methyltransferase/2-methoxy-6-polyprenyl-1,4-benzoquinol methylase UbiE [Bacteroidaceae bacterium]